MDIICIGCGENFKYTGSSKTRQFCNIQCSNKTKNLKRRKTKPQFVLSADAIHNSKYDYNLVNIDNKIVDIICPTHGVFKQNRDQHLLGKGCKECANNKGRKSKDQFVKEANLVHNNKYNYVLVDYINNATNVEIICAVHGAFWQLPYQHINLKSGCSECVKTIRVSLGEKQWLDSLGLPDDDLHRQVNLTLGNKKIWVDGKSENTIYEYLGDYWHGNPALFSESDFNKSTKKTYGELYQETISRFSLLENFGYTVKYIWESEWIKTKN